MSRTAAERAQDRAAAIDLAGYLASIFAMAMLVYVIAGAASGVEVSVSENGAALGVVTLVTGLWLRRVAARAGHVEAGR